MWSPLIHYTYKNPLISYTSHIYQLMYQPTYIKLKHPPLPLPPLPTNLPLPLPHLPIPFHQTNRWLEHLVGDAWWPQLGWLQRWWLWEVMQATSCPSLPCAIFRSLSRACVPCWMMQIPAWYGKLIPRMFSISMWVLGFFDIVLISVFILGGRVVVCLFFLVLIYKVGITVWLLKLLFHL